MFLVAILVLFLYDEAMLGWDDPISFIQGLTPQARKSLKSLEIETVGELCNLFPRRYEDYTHLVPIKDVRDDEQVTIRATVKELKQAPTFRRRFVIIRGIVQDETGEIGVTWFNQPWLIKQLVPGTEIYLSGSVTRRPRFARGFTSPLWEPATAETLAAGAIAPVYPLHGTLTLKTLRKITKALLDQLEFPAEWLPAEIVKRAGLIDQATAYHAIHWPESTEAAEMARRRFAFGELFAYQLALCAARIEADRDGAPVIPFDETFAKKFVAGLPFALTEDQKKAVWSAVQDMQTARPMRRLLQGDVGSGKTAVAAMLAACAFRSNASAIFMAPTDLLAKQHAETFRRFLVPHQIPVLLYTSSSRVLNEAGEEYVLTPAEARERLSHGRVVAVGTHALLERGQAPPDAALVLVDEQHRFGVAQRETLVVSPREDGKAPHLLSMSATPIPRSLALTLHGDLDVSIIRTKPAGRSPVITKIGIGEAGREQAYDLIRREAAAGHRTFVVCPLIDPSDKLGMKSVEAESKRLQHGPLRGLRVGMLHGKMSAKDKDAVMQEFARGALDVLVATTVVEVGVDVPEATVMVIEGAERFGLAQLHQLRGRVGRSSLPSTCFLIASDDTGATRRLQVLERTNDGFVVAEEDLHIRGEGNLLGVQQSGQAMFQMARADDLALMALSRESAVDLLQSDPDLSGHPVLHAIVEKMKQTSHQE